MIGSSHRSIIKRMLVEMWSGYNLQTQAHIGLEMCAKNESFFRWVICRLHMFTWFLLTRERLTGPPV